MDFFILFQLRVPKQPSLRLVRRSSATRFVSPLDVQYPSLDHSPDSLPPRPGQFVDLGRLGYQPHVNRDGWNSGHRSVPEARRNRGCLHFASRQLRYAIARGGSEFPRLRLIGLVFKRRDGYICSDSASGKHYNRKPCLARRAGIGNDLGIHDLSGNHLQLMGTLNLSSGQASASQGGINSKIRIKNLPAFLLGMAGGVTGLYLGIKYSGVHQYPSHLYIGITLLLLGTLQVSALFLRLAKDHRYRHVWNWFHHLTGYAVLLLSVANIWIGFFILKLACKIMAYRVWCCPWGTDTINNRIKVWKKLKRDRNTSRGNHANKARVQSARPPSI
ncbi:hypothetical protein C3L33_15346, partial [Rhododendron williamsianum]